ncbi:hypothetical protein [Desulfobaculum bizertense]|uniref:Uncharacterized protein n=1 Tax=Desulfobaculum bizertense DSM 18034 TaxID=1121442 RepID=A0A1T4VTR8_9BACT|nr:hypothetical protein [Desulfobaculum bizertense]UIJ38454.1 hypothetical protein LWC08_02495 [Desulfobaculum bizertense]SKA68228.1 hypothetical protein SAMN02745702_00969 [Desulfobaculum bizertense DSM 18034]
MGMDMQEMRKHITETVRERVSRNDADRKEALAEFFGVTMTGADERAADKLSEIIPPLLPQLYDKWIGMFVERLFETVPVKQLEMLCDGTDDNNATLILIYLMFLESERMEKQIDEDLRSYGLAHSGDADLGDVAASYIRAKMTQLGKTLKGLDEE